MGSSCHPSPATCPGEGGAGVRCCYAFEGCEQSDRSAEHPGWVLSGEPCEHEGMQLKPHGVTAAAAEQEDVPKAAVEVRPRPLACCCVCHALPTVCDGIVACSVVRIRRRSEPRRLLLAHSSISELRRRPSLPLAGEISRCEVVGASILATVPGAAQAHQEGSSALLAGHIATVCFTKWAHPSSHSACRMREAHALRTPQSAFRHKRMFCALCCTVHCDGGRLSLCSTSWRCSGERSKCRSARRTPAPSPTPVSFVGASPPIATPTIAPPSSRPPRPCACHKPCGVNPGT